MKQNLHQQLVKAAVFYARMIALISLIAIQFFGAARPVSALIDPNFSARFPEKQVHGYGWTLGGPDVIVSIDDLDNGVGEDYTATLPVIVAPWDPSQTFVQFALNDQPGFELQSGQIVTMTDGTITKTHTVSSLSITDINEATDTITGTVESTSTVDVDANCGDSGCAAFRSVIAVGTIWSADFFNDPDNQGTADIGPGSRGEARTQDNDGDNTTVQWRVLTPFIEASSNDNWVNARDWPDGTVVTLEIDDFSNGLGEPTPDYTRTATMGPAPWNPGDPNDIVADFDMSGFTLAPGDVITVSGLLNGVTKTKVLTISNLQVTSIDIGANTISGIATADAPNVEICVNVPGNCISRTVTVNNLGEWTANYNPDHDLQPGDNGMAAEYDPDLDRTRADWNIPNPSVQARANSDQVQGGQWPLASVVTIDVSRTGENITGTETVGPAPWDPTRTHFEHSFAGAFDIQVGDLVSVTDGSTTRTTTVTNLAFTNINLADDIVTGVATPNAKVDVWSCDGPGCYDRHVTANDTTGIWVANFGIVGSQPDEQTIIDIVPGVWIDSTENDANGSSTMYGISVGECYVLTLGHTGNGANPIASPSNSTGCAVGEYVLGESINLSGASPSTGWHIGSWTGTNLNSSTATTNTITMPGGAHTAKVIYIDNAPTVSMSSSSANPTNASPIAVSVTFSESVTGFASGDITTSNGTVSNFAGSGASYTFDLTPSANGSVTADIAAGVAQDSASNGNTAAAQFSRMYDGTAPSVLSSVRVNPNPSALASVDFTVTFSESVTGVDAADFTLATTGVVSGAAVSGFSGSGSVYTVTVSTGTGNGTIRLNVVDDDTIVDAILNPLGAGFTSGEIYTIIKSATFTDTPLTYWASNFIERLYNAGITGGCSVTPLNYCPDSTVTRAQMAVFLLKGMHGSSYAPPAVGASTGFTDVALDYWAAAWIKQLAAEGITGGCGTGVYCPDATVTRAQMAIFLLRAKHGSSYSPPAATGVFTDVPVGYWADKWIEQLAVEGITGGCGTNVYCPDSSVTRAQMAVFLVRAFNLP